VVRNDLVLVVGGGTSGGGKNNTLRLENGGAFVSSNNYASTSPEVIVGLNAGADNNAIFVGSGCVFTNLNGVTIGDAGDGNTLTISNGHMYAKSTCRVGESGDDNTATVKAGGDWQIPGHLWIGEDAGADGNTVTVTGSGSTLNVSSYELEVGTYGSTNLLAIEDGGSVIAARDTYIGKNAGATNNTLRIEGGSFQCTRATPHGITYVRNGSTFAVHGTNGTINLRQIQVLTSSTLDFRVDADGVTPIVCSQDAEFDNTTKLNIDAEGLQSAGGGTVTLMTFSNKNQDIQVITTQPAGCAVTQNATSITVDVPGPSGTVVSIK
jgi:T5SS/PEP-CTERM-associated repeat protein